jgi:DNA-binding beta-propeller fold protein YncE
MRARRAKQSSHRLSFFAAAVLAVSAVGVALSTPPTAAAQRPATSSPEPIAFVSNASGVNCGVAPASQQIRTFDLVTKTWGKTIKVPYCAWQVHVAPDNVTAVALGYTSSYSISVFNLATRKVIGSVGDLPLAPTDIAFSPDSATAFVLALGPRNDPYQMVYEIDLSSGKVINSLETTDTAQDIAVGDGGKQLLLLSTSNTAPHVSELQGLSIPGFAVDFTDSAFTDGADSETTSPDGMTDWVVTGGPGGGYLDPVNAATGAMGQPVPVTGSPSLGQLLIEPDGVTAILQRAYPSSIQVMNLETGTVIRTIQVTYYGFFFLDSDGVHGYVEANGPDTPNELYPVNFATGKVKKVIKVKSGSEFFTISGVFDPPST